MKRRAFLEICGLFGAIALIKSGELLVQPSLIKRATVPDNLTANGSDINPEDNLMQTGVTEVDVNGRLSRVSLNKPAFVDLIRNVGEIEGLGVGLRAVEYLRRNRLEVSLYPFFENPASLSSLAYFTRPNSSHPAQLSFPVELITNKFPDIQVFGTRVFSDRNVVIAHEVKHFTNFTFSKTREDMLETLNRVSYITRTIITVGYGAVCGRGAKPGKEIPEIILGSLAAFFSFKTIDGYLPSPSSGHDTAFQDNMIQNLILSRPDIASLVKTSFLLTPIYEN